MPVPPGTALIADKWTTLVLHALGSGGVLRHAELRRRIEGVSDKMLTQTLRDLERNGLVRRTDHGVIPPRVDYALTPLGRTLQEAVSGLCGWVVENMDEIAAAQDAYDAGPQPDARGSRRGYRAGRRSGISAFGRRNPDARSAAGSACSAHRRVLPAP